MTCACKCAGVSGHWSTHYIGMGLLGVARVIVSGLDLGVQMFNAMSRILNNLSRSW